MDLSALPEDQRQQIEDIQRRFQEHQQEQNLAQQFQRQQDQFQSYHHSNQPYVQPYQPYGEYYQYQHHYYHYQHHHHQPAPPSLPQSNADSSYSQYAYYQGATPVNHLAPAVAMEPTGHVGYTSHERALHSELNPAPAVATESTAHVSYNPIDRPPYLAPNPAPAVATVSTAQIGYSSIPTRLELNPAQPGAMESRAQIGYSAVERPARLEPNSTPSVAIESTVRIGYVGTERPAQSELNPAVAAALAEINKLSESIDIAQRTAALDMARRTAVRLHGGGSSMEHVVVHGLFNGASHPPAGLHSYSANRPPPVGGGKGKSKKKSLKNGASGRHHPALGVSQRNKKGQAGAKHPHKRSLPSANPNKAAEATSNVEKVVAWRCDLCQVDCNTKEILEQHKRGRKHRKNLERLDKEGGITINGPVCTNTGDEHKLTPSGTKEIVMAEEAKTEQQTVIEDLPSVKLEPSQQTATESQPGATNLGPGTAAVVEQPVNPPESQRTRTDKKKSNKKKKKKKKKKIPAVGGVKKPPHTRTAPQERKIVIPLSCHVCNIKCDTQEVLNKHFAGRKHIANMKRYQGYGHQPVVGTTGFQALYPSNPMPQSSSIYPPQPYPPQETGYLPQETQQVLYDPQVMYLPAQATYQ